MVRRTRGLSMRGLFRLALTCFVTMAATAPVVAQELSMSVASIVCSGNEPFWRLDITADEGVLTRPTADGVTEQRYSGASTWLDWLQPGWQVWRGQSAGEAGDVLVATMRTEQCVDSMAGDEAGPFDYVVLLSMKDMPAVNGCCRVAPPTDAMDATASAPSPDALYGREWLLEDIAGAGVIDNLNSPIRFNPIGTTSGHAGCNRFTGSATIGAGSLDIGPLATTRRFCAEAVMGQEQRFLDALSKAETWQIGDDGLLRMSAADGSELLRFAPGQ
jgi:heat shock protein HslJ